MKIEDSNTVPFGDIELGSAFRHSGSTFLRMRAVAGSQLNACELDSGEPCTFGTERPVTPLPGAKVIL